MQQHPLNGTLSAQTEPPTHLRTLVFVTIGIWSVFGIITYHSHDAWQERGQFGDMFGAVNALFSALAFAVLIYTMWLQRQELQLQRLELQQTREELRRSADAQDASRKALEKQIEVLTLSTRFSVWLKAQEVFTGKEFTQSRAQLFAHLDDPQRPWNEEEKENGFRVCRKMEELSALASFFPKETILREWGNPMAKAWFLLKPLVTDERKKSNWPEKWYAFENLATEARYKLASDGRDPCEHAEKRCNTSLEPVSAKSSA